MKSERRAGGPMKLHELLFFKWCLSMPLLFLALLFQLMVYQQWMEGGERESSETAWSGNWEAQQQQKK